MGRILRRGGRVEVEEEGEFWMRGGIFVRKGDVIEKLVEEQNGE